MFWDDRWKLYRNSFYAFDKFVNLKRFQNKRLILKNTVFGLVLKNKNKSFEVLEN